MIESFLEIIEKKRQEHLEELLNLFFVFSKTHHSKQPNKIALESVTYQFVELMISNYEWDISTTNIDFGEVMSFAYKIRVYKNSEIVPFGQYKGEIFTDVIQKNQNYVLWLILNREFFSIENSFFLHSYIQTHSDYLKAFEINLLKQFCRDRYDESTSESYGYNDFDKPDWNTNFIDGFEGNIDTWNHYNQ